VAQVTADGRLFVPATTPLAQPGFSRMRYRVSDGTWDYQFLKQAIELARQARTDGNHPFGALLVLDGRVILTAKNTVITQQNPTAHAEHNLVDEAIRRCSPDQIAQSTLYTSCEPCAMCVGAMYWAGIRSVVYGLPAEALAKLAGPDSLSLATIYFHGHRTPYT
jgi:tRNA(Arg) A34 adenosine deaminase TadA